MSDLGLELRGLYDVGRIRRELVVSRATAEALMRRGPKQKVPGCRKLFIRGRDLQRVLDENRDAA